MASLRSADVHPEKSPMQNVRIESEEGRRARAPSLDHGAIGNGRVLALVSPFSAIEWLCLPRFDSPSVFARILDRERGGTWRFLIRGEEQRGRLEYLPNTNVLRNVFADSGVAFELIDFAPRLPEGLSVRVPYEIIRLLRPLSGQPLLSVDFDPRPDYARGQTRLVESTDGLRIEGGSASLFLHTNLPLPYVLGRREFVLDRPIWFVLSHGPCEEPPSLDRILRRLELTIAGWRQFAKTCALPPFAPNAVLRSALCLKLHAFHDTGAIIAAATTSIPEAMGTPRTWDYRYCWLRDAAFVVEALRRLSHLAEGESFIRFLRDVAESGPLQPVYGIGGERQLDEVSLSHLAGFGGNGHVRVGNAAALQSQNDLMGEMVLCLETLLGDPRLVHESADLHFPLIRRFVEDSIAAATRPDMGIWEFRTMMRPYTFSRAMCWVAVHRGAEIARGTGQKELAERWQAIADREREVVLERGFNARLGCFTQELDGHNPDAVHLLLPTLGIIDARDERFRSTLDVYERELVRGGLMLRYKNLDDFGSTTSAFTICSFWWAEALALTGRLEEAVQVFERLLRHANPLGLFSEDIDPESGALLGNFPQAYTHVGLIHAAMTIGDLLAARDGRVLAWV